MEKAATAATKRKRPTPPTAFASLGWLQTHQLNMNTAIEYFSLSEYYNSASLQHKIFTGELTTAQTKHLKGIVYRIEQPTNQPPVQPPHTFPMFIIHEEYQEPNAPNRPLAMYYISDGKIYKSPSIYQILRTRVDKARQKIEDALSFLSSRTAFNQAKGWHWEENIQEGGEKGGEGGKGEKGEESRKRSRGGGGKPKTKKRKT